MWFPKREYHVEKLKIECSHMLTERYYSGHSIVLCLRERGTVCQQVGFKSLCLNRTSSTVKAGFSANFSHFFFYPRPHGLFILPSLGWAVKKAREKWRDYWTSSKIPFKNFFSPPSLSLSLPTVIIAPRECSDYNVLEARKNGVYRVTPDPRNGTFEVFCDMESFGGGWTVVQQRLDGSVSFNRTWAEYKKGFGNLRYWAWVSLLGFFYNIP